MQPHPTPCYSLGVKWPTSPLGQNLLHRHIRLKDYNVHLAQHKQVRLEDVAARPGEALQAERPVRETALLNSSSASSYLVQWMPLGSWYAMDLSFGIPHRLQAVSPTPTSPVLTFTSILLDAGGRWAARNQSPAAGLVRLTKVLFCRAASKVRV